MPFFLHNAHGTQKKAQRIIFRAYLLAIKPGSSSNLPSFLFALKFNHPEPQNLIAKKYGKNISFYLTINVLQVNIPPALTAPPKYMLKLYSFAYWETMTRCAELLIVILFS